jgi:integrase
MGKRGARWSVVYDNPLSDGKRRQKRKTFKTKNEADAFLSKVVHAIQNGTYVEPSSITLGTYLTYWLETCVRHNLRPTTVRSYEQLIRVHILPALGTVPLQKLQPAAVQDFYTTKLNGGRADGKAGGLAPSTVRHLHLILRESLQQAVNWEWVARNAAVATKPPHAPRPSVKTWSVDEMRRFLAVAEADGYAPVWLVVLATGLRRGELLGLRWQDVDLSRETLHVQQSLVEIGSDLVFQEPKTPSGRRTVALSPTCVAALRAHRMRQREQRRLLGSAWRDLNLVFTTADGGPIAPRNLIRRFKQLTAQAELPAIPFHGTRHTHATLLLRNGVHAKVVSERLGHSSISITLDTYSHILPDMQRHAVAGIDAALLGTEPNCS